MRTHYCGELSAGLVGQSVRFAAGRTGAATMAA